MNKIMYGKYLFMSVIIINMVYAQAMEVNNVHGTRGVLPTKQKISHFLPEGPLVRQEAPLAQLQDSEVREKTLREHAAPDLRSDVAEDFILDASRNFDVSAKQKAVVALVDKGVKYLETHPLDEALSVFSHQQDFLHGDLYLFVFDKNGVCLATGQETHLLWKNMLEEKGKFGTAFVQAILNEAQQPKNKGWVTYEWGGATKLALVKEVVKDGKHLVVGCGFYPHAKEDAVVNLVRGAVTDFNNAVHAGRPIDEVLSSFSYPLGKYIFGDLYLYSLDFNGIIMAQGDRPGLIGTPSLEHHDAAGNYANKEIIEKLKVTEPGEGIWITYMSKNAKKRTYAEKVTDARGRHFFIACGYYPEVGRKEVVDLVRRAYQYMEKNGKSEAVQAFNDRTSKEWLLGDAYITVYDLRGHCVANGKNPDSVGANQYDLKSENGRYYVREIIKKAQTGGGWVEIAHKNSFESIYTEMVDLGVGKFVISVGLFPVTKWETMVLLVKGAASYLRVQDDEVAFRQFVSPDSPFMRGDLFIITLDDQGICLTYGDRYDLIWRNLLQLEDDNGKKFIKECIDTVQQGPGTVTFTLGGATKTMYLEAVKKGGRSFVVGSGFFR